MTQKFLNYKVILEKDSSGGYIAICPSFQGCYSQGDTIEEALDNIKEAIELCIEDLESQGEPLPESYHSFVSSVVILRES